MMTNKHSRIAVVAILILALVAIAGTVAIAKNSTNDNKASVNVVASYYPLYDFARNVGGDKVEVTNVTPAGSEPHDYEPSPQQLVQADKSKVFIYNGGTMEPWVDKFLPDYRNIAVKASNGINLVEGKDDGTGRPSSEIKDPHFWLDPTLAAKIVDNITDGLARADPGDASYFASRAAAYKAKLAQLDKDYTTGLATCQTRTIITSHDAFSYLAKRYNLDIASIAGITPDAEPSAAKLAELTNLVRAKNIKYVFFESLVSPKLAQTLAAETGAKTAVFDPIEGISNEDQKQGKDYIGVQRENLANLRTALACE